MRSELRSVARIFFCGSHQSSEMGGGMSFKKQNLCGQLQMQITHWEKWWS